MAIIDDVASALSLNATSKAARANDINRYEKTARAELVRVGIDKAIANGDNPEVVEAIVTYCQMKLGNPDYYDRYNESWLYQIECLRKSKLED